MIQTGEDGFSRILRIKTPGDLAKYVVEKGSITIDGVSLTIVAPQGRRFTVALIPLTLEKTTLGQASVGDKVNLETKGAVRDAVNAALELLDRKVGLAKKNPDPTAQVP